MDPNVKHTNDYRAVRKTTAHHIPGGKVFGGRVLGLDEEEDAEEQVAQQVHSKASEPGQARAAGQHSRQEGHPDAAAGKRVNGHPVSIARNPIGGYVAPPLHHLLEGQDIQVILYVERDICQLPQGFI